MLVCVPAVFSCGPRAEDLPCCPVILASAEYLRTLFCLFRFSRCSPASPAEDPPPAITHVYIFYSRLNVSPSSASTLCRPPQSAKTASLRRMRTFCSCAEVQQPCSKPTRALSPAAKSPSFYTYMQVLLDPYLKGRKRTHLPYKVVPVFCICQDASLPSVPSICRTS